MKTYAYAAALAALIVLLIASFAIGHHVAAQAGAIKLAKVTTAAALRDAQAADAATRASNAARDTEQHQAQAFDDQAAIYERDKADAQAKTDVLVASLRDGNLRLRAAWRCTGAAASVPVPAASAGITDAAADDRIQSAGRVVRASADADAQIKALQAILRAERQP